MMTARKHTRREFLKRLSATAAALTATAAAGPLLSGCGAARGAARKAAEVALAASPDAVPDALIERFNRQFAPYHVTRAATSPEHLVYLLETGPADTPADTPAPSVDVAVLPALKLARLAQRGVLLDLAGLFQASPAAQGADLFGVDGYFTSAEQRWGMALSWSPDYLIWANTQMWQAAGVDLPAQPLSLEAWRALSSRLSAVQSGGLPVFGTDFDFDFTAMLWLAETLDPPARLFSADGRKLDLLSRPDFVEAVRFVMDWKKEGGIPFDPYKLNIPDCL